MRVMGGRMGGAWASLSGGIGPGQCVAGERGATC